MLRLSDPTLESTFIVDFEVQERFLKLPIQNYVDLLKVKGPDDTAITPTLNKPQNAIINAINDPRYRFVTACVSRRVGKTWIANIIAQMVLFKPGTNVLIIAPDYNLSGISWDLQHELLKEFDLETTRDNRKDRVFELPNGSTCRIASVGKIDSAVGRSYDLIIFDESAIADDAGPKFNVALRPTLDKLNSKCLFISTPRGDNWFKEYFERGFDPEYPEWVSIHADYLENPRASEEDIKAARYEMSHAEFEQEYLANFVTFEGQVWALDSNQIVDASHIIEKALSERDKVDIICGIDVGWRDEFAVTVIVIEPGEEFGKEQYWIVDEYIAVQRTTAAHASAINELIEKWSLDFCYIDSAAAQTRFDLAQMFDIGCVNAKKSKLDGIGAVGALVDNNRLFVHEECVENIYSLRNYRWKMNTEIQSTEHNRASHMADAIRYAVYTYSSTMGGWA